MPPISTKLTATSHFKALNIKKTMADDIGNPGPDLEQTQKCRAVKLVDEIANHPL